MRGKSLVIGAAGQVGNQIVHALGKEHALCSGRSPWPGWAQIDLASLADDTAETNALIDAVFKEHPIDAVYCVGGATDVERCESSPDWAMKTNYLGPAALAARCTRIPFVYFSTEYVFDGVAGPYTETSEKNPISQYGLSKSLGEEAILRAHPGALILRTTVVYGEDLQGKNFLYSLRRILGEGKTMSVPADQISTPTYNRDLAAASIALVRGGHQGIFHVAGPELLSRYDFAVQAAHHMGLDPTKIIGLETSTLKQVAKRPLNAGLLIGKLEQTLPSMRMRTLAEGVEDWTRLLAHVGG